MKRFLLLGILLTGITVLPNGTYAHHNHTLTITNQTNEKNTVIQVKHEISGLSLVAKDLGNDGITEFITGGGIGAEPRVRVLRQDGSEIGSFLAYAPTLGVGINVAVCDVTGDGFNEIITAPQRGGGPHIRIFDRFGQSIDNGGFFAYNEAFRGGVNLACGNIEGDATEELITLPGPGGGPHVRIWNWNNQANLTNEFFAFDATDRSGLVGDTTNGYLTVVQQHTSTPLIRTYNTKTNTLVSELEKEIQGLGVHTLSYHKTHLLLTDANTGTLYNLTTDEETFHQTSKGSLHITSDQNTLYTTSGRTLFHEYTDGKRIDVNISEQRLYAWNNGRLENAFYISSGLGNATPLGEHSVLAKVPTVHYAWNYGPDNPNNYDLGWIDYNLRIYPHIYIHYAPWHDNFGHKMSHGCVNVNLSNIQWVYAWAEEGIPVVIFE